MTSDSEGEVPKVLVAIRDERARQRVRTILRDSEASLELVDPDSPTVEDPLIRPSKSEADLMIVRRSRVRTEDLSLVDGYARRDEMPRLVVLRDDQEDDAGDRVRLLAAGAAGVLEAADSNKELLAGVQAAASSGAAQDSRVGRSDTEPRLSDFYSRSPSMRRFLEIVRRVIESDSSLLITGETGVGKERLAQAIHAEGARSDGPFVSVNCGALPEHLLESELFGHEAGAFTGATRQRKGRFEQAHGGTIFLDEIAEMPLHWQVNLLTVLQRRQVHRIGSEELIPIDIRLMAATNRDIVEEVRQGRFREDLFYRLNVVDLEIPPLRDRAEDIPDLVGTHIYRFRSDLGRQDVESISDSAIAAMMRYPWPGNVRELINAVEHAIVICSSSQISIDDLPEAVRGVTPPVTSGEDDEPVEGESAATPAASLELPLKEARQAAVARVERDYLHAALKKTRGRIAETAELAGITPRSLYDKMKRHGLRKEDYR